MKNKHEGDRDGKNDSPVVKTISVDETGLGTRTPTWLSEENKKPSDACLREIVLVGSPPEDYAPSPI
ncbi:MAG: hypothetical protein ABSE16_14575 [Verrucomicrobiota bacterium]|jgi:hypothetical protein